MYLNHVYIFARSVLLILLVSCVTFAFAGKRIVKYPDYLWKSNASQLDLAEVRLTDSSTVLYFDACAGQGMRISPETYLLADKVKYPIVRIEGIPVDRYVTASQEDTLHFHCVFPPLPKHVKRFDFLEGDGERAYRFYDITVKGGLSSYPLIRKLEKRNLPPIEELPKIRLKADTAVLSGMLLGYRSGMKIDIELQYYNPSIYTSLTQEFPKINADGTFAAALPLYGPTEVVLRVDDHFRSFYLQPGDTVELTVHLQNLIRNMSFYPERQVTPGAAFYFNGALARVNTDFYRVRHHFMWFDQTLSERLSMKEFRDSILTLYRESCVELQYNLSICPAARACLERVFAMDLLGRIFVFGAYLSSRNKEERESIPEYWDFIKELPLVDETALSCYGYGLWVNQLRHIRFPLQYTRQDETYVREVRKLPKEQVDSFERLYAQGICSAGDNSQADENSKQYESLNDDEKKAFDAVSLVLYAYQDSLYKRQCFTTEQYNRFSGIWKMQHCLDKMKVFEIPDETTLRGVRKMDIPYYSAVLDDMQKDLERKLSESRFKTGYTIHEMREIPNERLFQELYERHKGKVVLLDFWETWCAPCASAMKRMVSLKEELKDWDIVYVYVASESSPRRIWENSIPDISGEHILLTESQFAFLSEQYQMQGVPTYFIINRDGTVAYRKTGFPGNEVMRMKLLEACEKQ